MATGGARSVGDAAPRRAVDQSRRTTRRTGRRAATHRASVRRREGGAERGDAPGRPGDALRRATRARRVGAGGVDGVGERTTRRRAPSPASRGSRVDTSIFQPQPRANEVRWARRGDRSDARWLDWWEDSFAGARAETRQPDERRRRGDEREPSRRRNRTSSRPARRRRRRLGWRARNSSPRGVRRFERVWRGRWTRCSRRGAARTSGKRRSVARKIFARD